MAVLEGAKRFAERVTGRRRPALDALRSLVRRRKANTFRFEDDGFIPNNPSWPLVVYRGAVRFPQRCGTCVRTMSAHEAAATHAANS